MPDKETKNILTGEMLKKELAFLNKADMRYSLVLTVAMAVVFVPLSILPLYTFFSAEQKTVLFGIGCFLGCFVLLLPILICLFSLVRAIRDARLLKAGDWFVDVDEVRHKAEELRHKHTEDVLYFSRYGRLVSGGVAFQLASPGDAFYLVLYNKKKPTAVLHYSQKLYEYRE